MARPSSGECAPRRRPSGTTNPPEGVASVAHTPMSRSGWRLARSGRHRVSMGRHSAAHRSARASSVLGAGATALTLASLLAIAQTTVLPAAGAGGTSSASGDRGKTAAMDFQLVAGPLAIPAIGVVAPGFDDWYTSGPALGLFSPPARSGSPLAASVISSFSAVQSPSLPLAIAPLTVDPPPAPTVDATSPLAPALQTPATQPVESPSRPRTRPGEHTT